jgi:hypothetical protein
VFRGVLVALPIFLPLGALAAQVGYLPGESPFREIRSGRYVELQGGQLFGSGGPIGVGAQDGRIMGIRSVFRGRNSVQLGLGLWTAQAKRFIVDADEAPATRVKGPIDQRLIGGEFNIQLNMTGGKTWRGLAPFAGIGIGMVNGEKSPAADTSGYSFGTKFYFAPGVGTRYFLGQRAYLKVEARALVWKLAYPASYADEPAQAPGTVDNPNAVNPTGRRTEYDPVPTLMFGLGIRF